MRWNIPNHGDCRIKKCFLWLPMLLQPKSSITQQFRWLERVSILERYSKYEGRWMPIMWED